MNPHTQSILLSNPFPSFLTLLSQKSLVSLLPANLLVFLRSLLKHHSSLVPFQTPGLQSPYRSVWGVPPLCSWGSCYICLSQDGIPLSPQNVFCSSVTQSCPTLCDPTDCSMPGFPVLHYLLEFAQTHVIELVMPAHPRSPPSPPVLYLSQHQGLLQWVSSSHQVATVLELQLQHQSFQWIFRADFL